MKSYSYSANKGKKKKGLKQKVLSFLNRFKGFLILAAVLILLPVSLALVSQEQTNQQHASNFTDWKCGPNLQGTCSVRLDRNGAYYSISKPNKDLNQCQKNLMVAGKTGTKTYCYMPLPAKSQPKHLLAGPTKLQHWGTCGGKSGKGICIQSSDLPDAHKYNYDVEYSSIVPDGNQCDKYAAQIHYNATVYCNKPAQAPGSDKTACPTGSKQYSCIPNGTCRFIGGSPSTKFTCSKTSDICCYKK